MLYYDTDIQYIKGVGPHIAGLLARRSIYKIKDLFETYPRAYEDRRAARNLASLTPGELVSVVVQVKSVFSQNLGRSNKKMFIVQVYDSSATIICKYFRVPYKAYFERLQPGKKVRVVGKLSSYKGKLEFHHPDIRDFDEEENSDALIPLYSDFEGLSPTRLRKILELAFTELKDRHPDLLPQTILEKYKLVSREEALKTLHFPPASASKDFANFRSPAHERIIFEEFFWLELYLAAQKMGIQKEKALAFVDQRSLIKKMLASLSFELTNAQKRCLEEVIADLKKDQPMHRLVQGDVGSGKTMVALLAAAFVIEQKCQVALMVPTEILAQQHFKNAEKYLNSLGIRSAILTGSMSNKEHKECCDKLANGEIDLIIGTHALIQDEVEFHKLALVIIDEQHRFGVEQRKSLKQKAFSPHFLVMTATPIPRTLAMTVYGDLDVSVIDEMPVGRIPIVTRSVYEPKRPQVFQFLQQQVEQGRQAYIVYPLVEESEKLDLKNAVDECARLQAEYPKIKFGLLHGKMKDHEKSQIMQSFIKNEIQVLVSTTVIEVGVDVPNSNMMIIEHSERFGLSQLHQLRGRVGRGVYKSYCVLMQSYAQSDEAKQRAEIMVGSSDGFKIAEADLEMRGPGQFLGTRQSGLSGFKMANLVRDVLILQKAREAAFDVFRKDPKLKNKENEILRKELLRAHGPMALAGVG